MQKSFIVFPSKEKEDEKFIIFSIIPLKGAEKNPQMTVKEDFTYKKVTFKSSLTLVEKM